MRFGILLAALLAGCATKPEGPARFVGTPVAVPPPLGLPAVPSVTAEGVALGKRLFFETKLSADGSISCASCHDPKFGFADPRQFSVGVGGKTGNRNAPPALNAVFHSSQFWDGRAATLEEQALGPIANPVEMNLPHSEAVKRLAADPEYARLFTAAFGQGAVTIEKTAMAIASFERTLLSGDSPFDRYQYGGDKNAMSASAIRGLAIFKDAKRGNCVVCHTIGERAATFSDGKFHNLGVGLNAQGELADLGRFQVTKLDADRGAFRTSTLRNLAQTAPYMHDGSQKTLKDVVDFYVGGGSSNPYLDKEIRELKLSGAERADLIAFLEALTGGAPSL
ncbi:MAG: c-type cytochrome [Acidobacteria bacterium]|nr:c-type cytochrome [Acidobacteriota bacterium]